MAEGLSEQQPSVPARTSDELVVRRERPEDRRVYRFRFGIAYLALAVLAGVGVGSAIMLLDRPAKESGQPWSEWEPAGRQSSFDEQIADFVSGRYRLPSGNPLVGVVASPPEVQGVRVRAVAIQNDPEGDSDDISIVRTDEDTVMYVLCGLGAQCSIREGRPTEKRHQLLRREALELALYSFKYMDDLDSVIALLPPRPPANEDERVPSTALFFQKGDLAEELDQPLAQTLVRTDLPRIAEVDLSESGTIDRLTRSHLFAYEFTQLQEGSALLVLAPVTGSE